MDTRFKGSEFIFQLLQQAIELMPIGMMTDSIDADARGQWFSWRDVHCSRFSQMEMGPRQ